jgi:hypothetical protein
MGKERTGILGEDGIHRRMGRGRRVVDVVGMINIGVIVGGWGARRGIDKTGSLRISVYGMFVC